MVGATPSLICSAFGLDRKITEFHFKRRIHRANLPFVPLVLQYVAIRCLGSFLRHTV
jgi:hypothetical protein